ncbi:MAG: hypothetical protein ACLGHT_08810 [Acidimicrobiia bacterium]
MSISDQARHQLHTRLEQVLGVEEAATLIGYLPPVGWQDVATKRDLDAAVETLRGEFHRGFGDLRGELGVLRGEFGELRGEFGELRGELGELRGEFGDLRGEFGELRGEVGGLRGEFGELRGEVGGLRGELKAEIRTQTRSLFLSLVGLQITSAGLVIGVSRLI